MVHLWNERAALTGEAPQVNRIKTSGKYKFPRGEGFPVGRTWQMMATLQNEQGHCASVFF